MLVSISIGCVSLLEWFVVGLSRLLCQAGCLTGQRQGPALKWRSKWSIRSSATLARISSLVMRQMQKRHLTQVFSEKNCVALKLKRTKAQESFWCWCCSDARHCFFSQCQSDLWRCEVWLFGIWVLLKVGSHQQKMKHCLCHCRVSCDRFLLGASPS